MSAPTWILFELTANGFQAFISVWFIFRVLPYRNKTPHKGIAIALCSGIFFLLITILNFLFNFEGLLVLLCSILLFLFAAIFMQGSMFKNLLISLLPIHCIMIGGILSINLISLFTQTIPSDLIKNQSVERFLAILIGNGISFCLLCLVQHLLNKSFQLAQQEWVLMGAILSLSIVTFSFLYTLSFTSLSLFYQCVLSLAILGLVAINITAYFLLIQLSKKHTLETENILLKRQSLLQEKSAQELQKHYQELQKMRHDFKHNLTVLQVLNQQGEQEKVDEYIRLYLTSQEDTQKFVSTDNLIFNAILNEQLSKAYACGINVKLQIPFKIKGIEDVDLCSLIGNLFENAIEACQRCCQKKEIFFELFWQSGEFSLTIKNTIQASVLQTNPMLKTQKSDKSSHGYGTKIIRDITEKYHGMVDYYEENNLFCCHLILYPELEKKQLQTE